MGRHADENRAKVVQNVAEAMKLCRYYHDNDRKSPQLMEYMYSEERNHLLRMLPDGEQWPELSGIT